MHGLHFRFGHVWSMYRSSRLRSTLNTGYITGLGMCEVCTEAVDCVQLWTRVTLRFVWSMYRSSRLRSSLNVHGLHYRFGHVWSMYRSSPLRSTLNTGYITGLGMCEVCTEAVDCVGLWTRVTLQVWACVKYMYRGAVHCVALWHGLHYRFGMCEVCTEAVDWTRVTLRVWACVKYVPKQSIA